MKNNAPLRITAPIMIALVAILVYAARDSLLSPLVGRAPQQGGAFTSSGVEPAAVNDAVTEAEPAPDPGDGAAADTAQSGPPPGVVVKAGKIRKNSSLYVEMRRLGFTPVEIDRVARASRKTYSLKRVRPGQTFTAYTTDSGALDSLVFDVSQDQCLAIRRDGDGFVASMDTIPYTVSYRLTHGTINTSIFASLQQQGAETELASALDDIFGWTIDFISEIRRGDSYTILYERRTYPDGRTALGDVLAARVVSQGQEYHAFRFQPDGEGPGYFDIDGKSLQKTLRRSPLKFTRITSGFSGRRFHPIYKRWMPHYGVDYGAPRGTPIHATGDGTVMEARRWKGNGNYVKLRHNNDFQTYYLHMSRFAKGIHPGVHVTQGEVIGYVGATGAATAPHVCYRIKKHGKWVNPRTLSLPSKGPVPQADMAQFERVRDADLLRIKQSLIGDTGDQTIAVERPVYPTAEQRAALF